MNTERLAEAGDKLDEIWQQVAARLQSLSDPARQRKLKLGLYALAAVWMVFALAGLLWSLVPPPAPQPMPENIINPLVEPSRQGGRIAVDIDELASWELFGTAATAPEALPEEPAVAGELDGIENNAKETRLNLKLQGIVSSSIADQARAIIESRNQQEQYVVGDELPVGRGVKLAKILPDRVVIDNQGTYELLLLFEGNDLQPMRSAPDTTEITQEAPEPGTGETPRMDQRGDKDVTQLAEAYRRRLYTNPQSLAQVVNIAAVREAGVLKGYRVSAGRDREQFEALGFQSNDIVTGVNGIRLSDPGKAMELYRVMRSASEANFDVLRDGQELNLVVGLGSPEGSESDN